MLWYVLFNGLGGTANIPPDLGEAVRAMGLKNILTYKRLVLPAIRPALITGALTAWGGGWNALVVSEYVAFQNKTLTVNGIGALLNRAVFEKGDSKAMGLCLVAMVLWVVLINLVLWRPLYRAAAGRYRLEGSS
jgi:NitT/TauT family transport system permease protein